MAKSLTPFLATVGLVVVLGGTACPESESWKAVGWGGGGLYWSVAFHPTKDGVIYMGGDVLGVYKSVDHGLTWQHSNIGIAGYEVLSITTDPSNPERVYAVTSNGISRSDDGATHWQNLANSLPNKLKLICQKDRSVHCLAVDPKRSKRLAFASPDGRVLESNDTGSTWAVKANLSPGFASSVAFNPLDGKLFVASSKGLYRFEANSAEPILAVPGSAFAVTFDSTGRIGYAAMASKGVWRTGDGGRNWKATSLITKAGEDWLDIVVDAKHPNSVRAIEVAGWGGQSASSEDGGVTWSTVSKIQGDSAWNPTELALSKAGPLNLSMPRNLAINPLNGNELFIAANWRPVHTVDGGKSWTERSHGADISVITDVRFAFGKTYVTAMDEGVFVSDESPSGWKQLFPLQWSKEASGHQWRIQVWDGGNQILTAGSPWDTSLNLAFRSLDGGRSFIRVKDGLPSYLPTANTMWGRGYPRALASDPSNPYTVYLGIDGDADKNGDGGGVFKSVDGGWHWSQLKHQPGSRRMFYGIAVDPTDPKRLFWGTCGPGGGLYRSEDGGENWKQVLTKEDWVFNLTIGQDGTVYCPGKELWVSRDHGNSWDQASHFGDGVQIMNVELDPANSKRWWLSRTTWDATTIGGVYETTNGGKTWRSILGDLPSGRPLVLRYNAATKELWAAGPGLFLLKR